MKKVSEMDREELKELNKEKDLGVKVTKNKSDEDLRKEIQEALDKKDSEGGNSGPDSDEDDEQEVTFFTKYLGLHIGPYIFREGEFKTSDPEAIKYIKKSLKFGVTVFEKK